jgi:hypothetical protein
VIRTVSESWRAELARTYFKWEARAREAKMGDDVPAFRATLEAKLRGWVSGAEVRRRIDETGLIAVLGSGDFRPLAATGTSGSGVTSPSVRADDEKRIFGIPLDAAPDQRPIYCYLEGSDEAGAIASYGSIVVGFHERIKSRATFVLGDSRDATLLAPVFSPVPLLDPSIDAFSNTRRDLLHAASLAEACADQYRYAEVQVHGGLSATDITRVIYTRGAKPSREATELLRVAGLEPTCLAGDDPRPATVPRRG